jgi:predicted helicase
VAPILYRPFDKRFTYYTGNARGFISRPRFEVVQHILNRDNLVLVSARSNKSAHPDHFLCTRLMAELKSAESTTGCCMFPLYLYLSKKSLGKPNLSPSFISEVEKALGLRFSGNSRGDLESSFGAEDLFHYMYALFYSSSYRDRYAGLLRLDFPRVPITTDLGLFVGLGQQGADLVALHLMDETYQWASWVMGRGENPFGKLPKFVGSNRIIASGYPKQESDRIYINESGWFEGVSSSIWNFQIGGYQVCEKWLKDRRGRTLTHDDMRHYCRIVIALRETIRAMSNIHELIEAHGSFPLR